MVSAKIRENPSGYSMNSEQDRCSHELSSNVRGQVNVSRTAQWFSTGDSFALQGARLGCYCLARQGHLLLAEGKDVANHSVTFRTVPSPRNVNSAEGSRSSFSGGVRKGLLQEEWVPGDIDITVVLTSWQWKCPKYWGGLCSKYWGLRSDIREESWQEEVLPAGSMRGAGQGLH